MESSFTWLDNSDRDRQRAEEALHLFNSSEQVRDELGLGVVRDVFADLLFPGTSTIQTRARYFLFVPWVYKRLERKKTRSDDIERCARRDEVKLIRVLSKGEDADGVIGKRAQESLKRLPSNVYWNGLKLLGIRNFPGPQRQYHRSLDRFYAGNKENPEPDGDDNFSQAPTRNWHGGLPAPPRDFLKEGDLSLRRIEAEYLRERILKKVPGTLFEFYAKNIEGLDAWPDESETLPAFWDLDFDGIGQEIRTQMHHARCFSEVFNGASLLYNLMLTERCNEKNLYEGDGEEKIGYWSEMRDDWIQMMEERSDELKDWDESEFWEIVEAAGPIHKRTKTFISSWVKWVKKYLVTSSLGGLFKSEEVRALVRDRESSLKKGRSRFGDTKYLELWSGASQAGQMDFRWGISWRLLEDIRLGLQQQEV